MDIKIFKEPTMLQNLYLYYDEATKQGVVIDPGAGGKAALRFMEEAGLSIQMILLTHAHFDHISTLKEIRDFTGAPILVHREDATILEDSRLNHSIDALRRPLAFTADRLLEDGEVLSIGGGSLQVLHTPGHSPGSVCYYDAREEIVFTGDTLFYKSVGRSDLRQGDGAALVSSIREKLFTLPEAVKVYPGHMKVSTIGYERRYNPFVGTERA